MYKYTFTTELRTPFWFKVLRYFKIKQPRHEFKESLDVNLYDHGFRKGDIIELEVRVKLKIVNL